MRAIFLLLSLLLAPLAAQTTYTAYPIDELHGSFGHWAPFGILSTGNADECRTQNLILAPWLPPVGALITGIEAAPHVEGIAPYQSLEIVLGTTTNTTLNTTFDNNLARRSVVFQRQNFSINWASRNQWVAIDFTVPFIYAGSDNLVVETRKIIDRPNNPSLGTLSIQFSNAPMRRDLPGALFREGAYNSGASTAATGSPYAVPMLMRLRWRGPDTLNIKSTRVGGSGVYFRGGATLGLNVQSAPGSIFLNFMDGVLAPTAIPTLPAVGRYWFFPRFFVLGSGTVDPSGLGSFTTPIPTDPALVGTRLYFQSIAISQGLTALAWTNVVDAILAQ